MEKIVLQTKQLSKKFKKNDLLNDIQLTINEGQIVGFIGRNGSGKSMLFKCLCGFIQPTSGKIWVFEEEIKYGKFPKNLGILFDKPGFIPHLSGFKNLKLLASIQNKISDISIKQTISQVGLNPEDPKPVKKYSLGMKQRLALAQAIMEKPKLLILDEPMNGLDEEGVNDMRQLFLHLQQEGTTILLSSHHSEDIQILCNEIYKMDKGILTKQENPVI